MATCHTERHDALRAIDCECRACERAIDIDGSFAFDRGREARLAHDRGAVYEHAYLDDPIGLRLRIDETILIDDSESPREVLVAWLRAAANEIEASGKGGAR